MSKPVFAKWLILIGTSASALGIILYSQLSRIVDLRVSLVVLNGAAILSHSLTLLGLLATLIGAVFWPLRTRLVHILLSGLSVGIATFLLAILVDINVHGPTAILLYVVFAGALGCALMLLIAAVRFALSRRRFSPSP